MDLRIDVAGGSHVGLVRPRNEDTLYLGTSLVAVADGLGGHVAGDVASATAVEALRHYDRQVTPEALATSLGQAIAAANRALRLRTETEPELGGMGTTLVALLRSGTSAALANVGDSARGANTPQEFDELIKKANQTKAYIVFLHKQSSAEE